MSRKHPSTRVSQPSGGRQSFNLFSSEPAAAPAPTRSSTRVHNKPASFNPMNPDGAREQQPRRSRVVRQNSATFTSDANSPFSKAPRPQAPPREHRANVPSAGNPFGSDDGAPAPAPTHQRRPSMANKPSDGNPFVAGGVPPPQPAQREYRANVPSQASPFSNAPAPPQPQQQRPVPRANAPSHDLPFSAPASAQAQYQQVAPPQPAQPKVRSSVRLHQPAGGRTSIDLFGRKPEEARPVRNNPTYQSDVDLAFDPTPKPEMHTPTRRPSRANVPAQNSPFNPAAAEQPPAEPRRGPEPRANKPARDSPFNPAPDAPRPANRNRANRPSMQGGPFGGPVEQAPQRSSVRMHHRPGGKQNINLFGGHNYPS